MKLTVNGKAREFDDGLTVRGLIEKLNLADRPVAVELNREIVKKENHSDVVLKDGDTLEVIHFVGGG